jgi:hypothetical protein
LGANIVLEKGALRLVNKVKLPAEALAYITKHRSEIGEFLREQEGDFEERSAIIEFDGRSPREWAHQFADILIRHRPPNVSDLDWSWFITRCGQIIDEGPAP